MVPAGAEEPAAMVSAIGADYARYRILEKTWRKAAWERSATSPRIRAWAAKSR